MNNKFQHKSLRWNCVGNALKGNCAMNMDDIIRGATICEPSKMKRNCSECPYREEMNCDYVLYHDVVDLLKEQPKTGHWIEKEDYNLDTYYDCSVCGESWMTVEGTPWQNGMNYCPHCGAKMIE